MLLQKRRPLAEMNAASRASTVRTADLVARGPPPCEERTLGQRPTSKSEYLTSTNTNVSALPVAGDAVLLVAVYYATPARTTRFFLSGFFEWVVGTVSSRRYSQGPVGYDTVSIAPGEAASTHRQPCKVVECSAGRTRIITIEPSCGDSCFCLPWGWTVSRLINCSKQCALK